MSTISDVLADGKQKYLKNTPDSMKVIDAFLVALLFTGGLQALYVCLAGTFPFNSFLSGFGCTVGLFVLTVSLRLQMNSENNFDGRTPERAFADYVFGVMILFLVVTNFMG